MNTTILLSIFIITICFAAISIKMLILKDGKFSGTCASNNPLLNKEGEKCSYCGADPGDFCKKEEKSPEK